MSVNAPACAVVEVVDDSLDRREVSVSLVVANESLSVLAESHGVAISCDATEEGQAAIKMPTSIVTQLDETSF